MNKRLSFFLMNCMLTMPLLLIGAEPPEKRVEPTFYPQIWPNEHAANQWICDSLKWTIEEIERKLVAWDFSAMDQLDDTQKQLLKDAEIKANEIVGWVQDKTPENRKTWQNEFFNKIRMELLDKVRALSGRTGLFRNKLSQEKEKELRMLHQILITLDGVNHSSNIGLINGLLRTSKELLGKDL